jgi:hypothetical protein
MNNVRCDASRHFRNKRKAYLKAKSEELETNSKINNIRDLYGGINDFKKGYQPRSVIVKVEKGDLFADSHSIMARWRNYFSQIFNVMGLVMLGRQKCTQRNHLCLSQVSWRLSWLVKSQNVTNHKVSIKYQQN